jgi:hypothetical protein
MATGCSKDIFEAPDFVGKRHPVRVDIVYKGTVPKEMGGNEVEEDATQRMAEENGWQVNKFDCLSKPETSQLHDSMVLHLPRLTTDC